MSVTPTLTIIEVSGHIIDSLTLAKVIDKIQSAGCGYQINDLQIGEKKNDISTAQISLWHQDENKLQSLLAELTHYGAHPLEAAAAQTAPCPQDGTLPKGAYTRLAPPMELCFEENWIPVDRRGFDLVIVVDPVTRQACLKRAGDVKQGEHVVIGKTGIKVLPTMGETAHAQSVA